MAGGIDWFRWHHGSVTDPKFGLVAKRAKARRGDVITIWAHLLEQASQSTDRGAVGTIDCDSIDLMLDCDEGTTAAVLVELEARGMTVTSRDAPHVTRIAKWEERQPKREDETAAERQRRKRERDHELALASAVTGKASRDVTQQSGDVTQKTPDVTHGHDRGEESREEENSSSLRSEEKKARRRAAAVAAPPPPPAVEPSVLIEAGFTPTQADDFIAHKQRVKAPLTERAWADHLSESSKAGWSAVDAAEKVMAKAWKGFEAKYVADERPPARAAPVSFRERDAEAAAAKVAAWAPELAAFKAKPETVDVIARRLD